MLSEQMQKGLNDQLNYEMFSAYVYYSMEAWFLSRSLNGFANWMHVQAMEEMTHVMKFFTYINEKDGRVLLQPVGGPQTEWKSPKDAFETALEHEKSVTHRINDLVDLALKERDHATNAFLQWFVNEQVEEESNARQAIDNLKLAEDAPGAILLLDREMAARMFVPPAAEAD